MFHYYYVVVFKPVDSLIFIFLHTFSFLYFPFISFHVLIDGHVSDGSGDGSSFTTMEN